MKKIAALYLATLLVLPSITPPVVGVAAGTAAAGNADRQLDSGSIYWQNQTMGIGNAPASTTYSVHEGRASVGSQVATVQTDDSGRASVSTAGLSGDYLLTTAGNQVVTFTDGEPTGTVDPSNRDAVEDASVEIIRQNMDVSYEGWVVSDGGDTVNHSFAYDGNRGSYSVQITSPSALSGLPSVQPIAIDVGGIPTTGTATLEFRAIDSDVRDTVTANLGDPPSITYQVGESYQQTYPLTEGESYLQTARLEANSLDTAGDYGLYERTGAGGEILQFRTEVTTNASGGISIDTSELLGEYVLINDTDGLEPVTNFTVREQTISTAESRVTLDYPDDTGTIDVTGDWDGPLLVWSTDVSSSVLSQASPTAERNAGDVIVRTDGSSTSIALASATLEPGIYEVHIGSYGAPNAASVTVDVDDTGSVSVASDDGPVAVETVTATATATSTSTETATATATSTPTDTATPSSTSTTTLSTTTATDTVATMSEATTTTTGSTTTGETTGETTPASGPGFGGVIAFTAIVATMLIGWKREWL